METIIIYLFVYLFYIFTDLIQIYKDKKIKEFWIYLVLLLIGYIIFVLYSIGIKIVSPASLLEKLLSKLFQI